MLRMKAAWKLCKKIMRFDPPPPIPPIRFPMDNN